MSGSTGARISELALGPRVDVRQLPVAESALQGRHGGRIARPSRGGRRVDILGRMADEPGRTLRFVPDAPRVVPDDGSVTVVLDSTWTRGRGAGTQRAGSSASAASAGGSSRTATSSPRRPSGWMPGRARPGSSTSCSSRARRCGSTCGSRSGSGSSSGSCGRPSSIDLVRTVAPSRIVCEPGTDDVVIEAARLIAARDGLGIEAPEIPEADRSGHAGSRARSGAGRRRRPRRRVSPSRRRRVRQPRPTASFGWPRRGRRRPTAPSTERRPRRRRRAMTERLEPSRPNPARLLVVLEHARQRVETAGRATRHEPVPLPGRRCDSAGRPLEPDRDRSQGRASMTTPGGTRLERAGRERGCCRRRRSGGPATTRATPMERRVDAGLAGVVGRRRRGDPDAGRRPRCRSWPGARRPRRPSCRPAGCRARRRAVTSIRALLRRLRPAGVLLADEYHRQDWLTAAARRGRAGRGDPARDDLSRPQRLRPSRATRQPGLAGPDVRVRRVGARRAGRWQRLSATTRSGSAARRGWTSPDRRRMRMRAGRPRGARGRPGDRMVVLSGTYGPAYRRFHIPYALDRLARPAMARTSTWS